MVFIPSALSALSSAPSSAPSALSLLLFSAQNSQAFLNHCNAYGLWDGTLVGETQLLVAHLDKLKDGVTLTLHLSVEVEAGVLLSTQVDGT
jgi:hypothetical protein